MQHTPIWQGIASIIRRPRGLAPIVLLSAAIACSGGDKIVSPDARNNNTSNRLSPEDSLFVINQIAGAAFSTIKAFRNISNPGLPGIGSSVPPCTPAVTGNTDANGNGIPEDRLTTYTAANCSYNNNGTAVVVTGSVRVQDLGVLYGYRITYNNFNTVGKRGDSTYTTMVDGSIEYAYTSATSARSLDNLAITLGAASSLGGVSLARQGAFSTTFAPSGTNTIALTRSLPSGSLNLTGTLTVIATFTGNQIPAGGPASQTVAMNVTTTTPLTANQSCTSDASIDSGQLNATVSGSQFGAAVARFTGCGVGGGGPTAPSGGGKK
jgi:hypothetical protein